MRSIKSIKNMVELQWVLERLIEDYTECIYESDKYHIKLQLLNFIIKKEYSIKAILNYMKLSYDKFLPFISILESSNCNDISSKLFSKSKKSIDSNNQLVFSMQPISVVRGV